jgi:hypothetical protein
MINAKSHIRYSIFVIWAHPRLRSAWRGPGYRCNSSAPFGGLRYFRSIPCAAPTWHPCHVGAYVFAARKRRNSPPPASVPAAVCRGEGPRPQYIHGQGRIRLFNTAGLPAGDAPHAPPAERRLTAPPHLNVVHNTWRGPGAHGVQGGRRIPCFSRIPSSFCLFLLFFIFFCLFLPPN